ncbi:hypothetical protein Pres01_42790 [Metapseudomonas resinovorans]|nr:hypothetical protein Pres01_42790 [Pseudomonas resinovorans]
MSGLGEVITQGDISCIGCAGGFFRLGASPGDRRESDCDMRREEGGLVGLQRIAGAR